MHRHGLGGVPGPAAELLLVPRIVDYGPGNSFGRWLWPGIGKTVLSIECKVYAGSREVGTVGTTRQGEADGLYSIGQWREIFKPVAADIATQLKKKLRPTAGPPQ